MEMLDQRAGRSDLGCGGDVFVVPGELVPGGKAGSGKRDLFFRRIVAPIDRGLALSGGACRILDLALVASGSGSLQGYLLPIVLFAAALVSFMFAYQRAERVAIPGSHPVQLNMERR